MDKERKLILVSNDDGIYSKGLLSLIEYVKDFGDVIVVAPSSAQSGKSSAITVEEPLRAVRIDDYMGATRYKVSGTPVDCVKLAMHTLSPRRPDLVISGINHGGNTGISTIYSGTMGAAFEGSIVGIPSIGFSLLNHSKDADFSVCESVVKTVVERVIANGLPDEICLNVNIPNLPIVNGLKVVEAAKSRWTDEFDTRIDPHGKTYYWLTGHFHNEEPTNEGTDLWVLAKGYVSIVPCRVNQTAIDKLGVITSIFDQKIDI